MTSSATLSLSFGNLVIDLPESALAGTEAELVTFVATKLLKHAGLYSELQELADSLNSKRTK